MSTTDLMGQPLGALPEFRLNKWQKRQATLLYYFASLDRLNELKALLGDFVNGVDITLDLAMKQGRDELIANPRWGMRNTATNFGTFAHPALKDFQRATNKDIAHRASESYEFTGYNQCARLIEEMSKAWTTPDEENYFEAGLDRIGKHASLIDDVMQRRFDDASMQILWHEVATEFSRLPKFRVRTDVTVSSGKRPVRTGVYVPQDDALGTLQFAWTGNADGELFDCKTFNELGLQAYLAVGRDAMYSNDPRLVPIANQPQYRAEFTRLDWNKDADFLLNPRNAAQFIMLEGFTTRPCKWYFVERVEGEVDDESESGDDVASPVRLRCEAGEPCPREGYWLTPARADSRRGFNKGDVMPEVGGDYGASIWQWDEEQDG